MTAGRRFRHAPPAPPDTNGATEPPASPIVAPLPAAAGRRTVTAAEVVANPHAIEDADPAALPTILAQLSAATVAVAARMAARPPQAPPADTDRLVKVDDAAALLSMSEAWCLRSDAAKPFRVRTGTDVRFSVRHIQRFIERQRGR
jgi:hypothetical protein